jgi:hypothetical protein
MTTEQILILQFTLNLAIYALVARWYITPRLAAIPLRAALIPLLLPHALRTFGLVFLVPTVVDPNLPAAFAIPAAYGDLLAALLALGASLALRARWRLALALVWLFAIEGTVDLLYALYQGAQNDLTSYQLGVAWYIPTFLVPAALVTHALIFILLVTRAHEYPARLSGAFAGQRA